jgi:hypothetical protein
MIAPLTEIQESILVVRLRMRVHLRMSQRHISGLNLLNFPRLISYERFVVFTAVSMKNAILWDVTQCGS